MHLLKTKMERNLGFPLFALNVSIGFVAADWNILNQRGEHRVEITLKNYCESWRLNVELHNIREFEAVPEECTSCIGKYMNSVQYQVDSERTIDEWHCVSQLEERWQRCLDFRHRQHPPSPLCHTTRNIILGEV